MKKFFLLLLTFLSGLSFAIENPVYFKFKDNNFIEYSCNEDFSFEKDYKEKLNKLKSVYLGTKITGEILFYSGAIIASTGVSMLSFNFYEDLTTIERFRKINTNKNITFAGLGITGTSLIFKTTSSILKKDYNFTLMNAISEYNGDYLYFLSKNKTTPPNDISVSFKSNIYPYIKLDNKIYKYKTFSGYDKELMSIFLENTNSKAQAIKLEKQINADIGMLSAFSSGIASSAILITCGNLFKKKEVSAAGISLFLISSISKIVFENTKENRAKTVFNMIGEYSGGKVRVDSIF